MKYKVYPIKSEFYTENEALGKSLERFYKKEHIVSTIAIIFEIGLFCCLVGCIGIKANSLIYDIILASIAGTCLLGFLISLLVFVGIKNIQLYFIKIYINSQEYKQQYEQLCEKNKKIAEEKEKEKAKQFIEMYEVLEDKKQSKEEKGENK